MTEEAKRILEILPELIREDEGFRLKLWQVLNGEFSSKKDLAQVLEEIRKSREESTLRFEASERRFEDHREEVRQRFERIDRRFERIDRRFERIDRRFERIDQRFDDQADWVGIVVGGFQVRAGRTLEDAVAGTLRIALKMKSVDPSKITLRRKILDSTGLIGPAGRIYEVDIVATNGETWLFEVKSVADEEDVERFNDKAVLAIQVLGLTGARKALITLAKSAELRARCQERGIELG